MRKLYGVRRTAAFTLATALMLGNLLMSLAPASAASLTNTYLEPSRLAAGQTGTLRLVFKTASAGATALTINMNGADATTWSGSSGSVHSGTMTTNVSTCNTDTGATSLPGSLTVTGGGGSSDGHTIAITGITALAATTSYCIDFTNTDAVTLATAGEYHPTITESSGATDSITVAVRTVSNDQIVVNAVVPPTFSFGISGCSSNIDNFGSNLSTTVTSTGGCTVTVSTNAKNGWIAWAKDASTGLHSTAAGSTISSFTPGTNTTLTNAQASASYLTGITTVTQGSGAGTTSAANAYGNGSGGTAAAGQGSGLDTTYRQVVSSTGTASSASFVIKESAVITALTPAANDYTDTITVVGAGNF